jgi:hypothetical protein
MELPHLHSLQAHDIRPCYSEERLVRSFGSRHPPLRIIIYGLFLSFMVCRRVSDSSDLSMCYCLTQEADRNMIRCNGRDCPFASMFHLQCITANVSALLLCQRKCFPNERSLLECLATSELSLSRRIPLCRTRLQPPLTRAGFGAPSAVG